MTSRDHSETSTRGIRVEVQSILVPERSDPDNGEWFYAYRVHIENEGETTAQLVSRHWIIIDGRGHIEEVRGPGVIGEQPVLQPTAADAATWLKEDMREGDNYLLDPLP